MSTGATLETHNGVEATHLFPWWVVLIEGGAAIIIGILLFLAPQATLELVLQLFGLFWLVDGVLRLANAFTQPQDRGLKITMGAFGILAGIAVVRHPAWLAVALSVVMVGLIGCAGIAIGTLSLVQGFRGGGFGAVIVGIISLLFGLVVLFNPWLNGVAWVYLYAGASLIGGVVAIVYALRMRRSAQVALSVAAPVGADQVVHPGPT